MGAVTDFLLSGFVKPGLTFLAGILVAYAWQRWMLRGRCKLVSAPTKAGHVQHKRGCPCRYQPAIVRSLEAMSPDPGRGWRDS